MGTIPIAPSSLGDSPSRPGLWRSYDLSARKTSRNTRPSSRLRPEDVQLRFFGSLSKFHHPVLVRFTQVDYDREMAFIATAPTPAASRRPWVRYGP